jgi:STAS domain-containing protein
VPSIDSSGFAALFDAHQRFIGQGRELTIRGVRAGPMRLMRATGLHTQFHLEGAAGGQTTDDAARRVERLRRLYGDVACELDNFERHRELWARIEVEQQALAKRQSTECQQHD